MEQIQTIMHTTLSQTVLPNLIHTIKLFTQDIVNNRRGIANTLFNWFKTSSSSNLLNISEGDEDISLYHDNTIEFKIRFIADFAFLFEVQVDLQLYDI